MRVIAMRWQGKGKTPRWIESVLANENAGVKRLSGGAVDAGLSREGSRMSMVMADLVEM